MKWPEKSVNLVSVGGQIYYKELNNGRIHYDKNWFQQAISRTSNITEVNMTSDKNARFGRVLLYPFLSVFASFSLRTSYIPE